MNFIPKTESEIKQSLLLSEGTYKFEVTNATDEISKSGNEMIKLVLQVWDYESGKNAIIFDYLLEKMAYKLRHFCASVNLMEKYENGQLKAIDCIGKKGSLEIGIQPGQQNPSGGYYPDKNMVKDYVVSNNIPVENIKESKDGFYNDSDVPF